MQTYGMLTWDADFGWGKKWNIYDSSVHIFDFFFFYPAVLICILQSVGL